MGKRTPDYDDYMQSKAWDKKRRQRLKLDGYTCQECGATDAPLDVHHLTYERFGREDMDDLKSLCRQCHDREHQPHVEYGICGTCGKLLAISIRKVRVFGTSWTDYTCQDGHMRSYRDGGKSNEH